MWKTKEGFVRAWVNALRSGKYTQATGKLRDEYGMCCLGVACDVWDNKGWKQIEGRWYFWAEDVSLPPEIRDFLGANHSEIYLNNNTENEVLSHYNDNVGLTFDEIADMIEEAYLA